MMKRKDCFEERRAALLLELESLQGEGTLYGFLMKQGGSLPFFAEEWRTDACLLRGCQYRVWLHLELEDGLVRIHADSDSLISRGLMALWVRVFSSLAPGEVLAADAEFLHRSVLGTWLIPSRTNALGNMASRIKLGVLKLRQEARRKPLFTPASGTSLADQQGPIGGMASSGSFLHGGLERKDEFPR